MRKLTIAGAALLAAAPALAQPEPYGDEWQRNPAPLVRQDIGQIAGAMERMVGAIMDLPVGGIAAAIDPLGRGGIYPGDTVGDLASRDDPYAEARIRAGIRGTARGVGAMSEAFARMVPVLQRSLDEVSRDVEAAMDEAEREPY